jgi:phosphopantothenoylcysteine decarboxylase/phosphopantothenate--cysteine ligase
MTEQSAQTTSTGKKVALGISGGIACYKAAEILRGLQRAGCDVRVAMTKHACEFVQPLTFRALSGSHVIVDDYATDNPDPIAHITFSQTVDLLLVAPATANIIAKFANGVADDFLTTTYLAAKAPVLIAPAMNTSMWEHPATQRNLDRLRADGVTILEPDAGEMACGTIGPGRLSDPERIVTAALELLNGNTRRDLAGERVLLTVGATRENIDPVRFISNRSSGRMGFAVAQAAKARGAEVVVVAGFTSASAPAGVQLVSLESAGEMHEAVMKEVEHATIFIGAAAVADYKPVTSPENKIKKDNESLELKLTRTQDILSDVAAHRRNGQIIVGFAAETDNVIDHARQKLITKKVDLIVANDITKDGAGFDTGTNVVTFLTNDRDDVLELPLMSKLDAANRILDEVVRLRGRTSNKASTAS